jgi:DNA-binding CsgD family transcriptional regulator
VRPIAEVVSSVEHSTLRPIERRVLRLVDDGLSSAEIARRFGHSPQFIERLTDLARLPERTARPHDAHRLRPVERRVLAWLDKGEGYADIAPRFRRSPEFIARVEQFAQYKLSSP